MNKKYVVFNAKVNEGTSYEVSEGSTKGTLYIRAWKPEFTYDLGIGHYDKPVFAKEYKCAERQFSNGITSFEDVILFAEVAQKAIANNKSGQCQFSDDSVIKDEDGNEISGLFESISGVMTLQVIANTSDENEPVQMRQCEVIESVTINDKPYGLVPAVENNME